MSKESHTCVVPSVYRAKAPSDEDVPEERRSIAFLFGLSLANDVGVNAFRYIYIYIYIYKVTEGVSKRGYDLVSVPRV